MAASNFERRRFYQRVCIESRSYENRTSYTIACPDGTGLVTCYHVFPGAELALNDFHAFHCLECYDGGDPFQLDFCYAGRFECAFSPKEHCILVPGDLAIHQCAERGDTEAEFPLGYYQGVNLTIDCTLANEYAARHFGALAPDFLAIRSCLLSNHWFWVQKAAPQCAAIFRELAGSAAELAPELLQLKLLELLWLLEHMPLEQEEFPYFPKFQIELVKHIREQLANEPDCYTSVEALACEHQISVTQNLNMENVTVSVTDETSQAIAAVVGYSMGSIDNITLKNAAVTGNTCTGGIAGGSMGVVTNCRAENVEITVIGDNDFSDGLVQADIAECGGLVIGGGFGGTIDNCTASGTVRAVGNEPVGLGGIGGCLEMMDSITNCSVAVTIESPPGPFGSQKQQKSR